MNTGTPDENTRVDPWPPTQLAAAQKAIQSTIRKSEKVCATLSANPSPRPGQLNRVTEHLRAFRTASILVEGQLKENAPSVDLPATDLKHAAQILPVIIQQIQSIMPKFNPGTPQHTLAIRRIEAFQLALSLIHQENISP